MPQKEIGSCADARAPLLWIALLDKLITCSTPCTTENRVHLSPCATGQVCTCYTAVGTGEGGVEILFAAVQLLPWTLRAAGGGRGEVKRHNGMDAFGIVCKRHSCRPAYVTFFWRRIMCLLASFNPNASHLLPPGD